MPYSGPGARVRAIATKAVNHGQTVIENGIPGIAAKSTQLGPFVDPATAAATQIAIGEEFIIMVGGVAEVPYARWSVGGPPTVGMATYIVPADNTLSNAAAAGVNKRYGLVQEVDAARSVARVNTNVAGAIT